METSYQILPIIMAGIAAGLARELSALLLQLAGLRHASIVSYEGCMITNRTSGDVSYIAGMTMNMILSVSIALYMPRRFVRFGGSSTLLRTYHRLRSLGYRRSRTANFR